MIGKASKSKTVEDVKMTSRGIFCLEGEWGEDWRDPSSVVPLLQMLDHVGVPHVHRRVVTKAEVQARMDGWLSEGSDLPVAYLDDLLDMLGSRAAGRIVYLGGCEILSGDKKELMEFGRTTKIKALASYTKLVQWVEGASFELVLLPELVRSVRIPTLHARLAKNFPVSTKAAGFRIATKDQVFTA